MCKYTLLFIISQQTSTNPDFLSLRMYQVDSQVTIGFVLSL